LKLGVQGKQGSLEKSEVSCKRLICLIIFDIVERGLLTESVSIVRLTIGIEMFNHWLHVLLLVLLLRERTIPPKTRLLLILFLKVSLEILEALADLPLLLNRLSLLYRRPLIVCVHFGGYLFVSGIVSLPASAARSLTPTLVNVNYHLLLNVLPRRSLRTDIISESKRNRGLASGSATID
jgi:hypothetical protein